MVVGMLGCLFGVLGIFTVGAIFVPPTVLCGLVAVLSGARQGSMSPIFVAGLRFVLSVAGFAVSPSAWLLMAGIAGGTAVAAH